MLFRSYRDGEDVYSKIMNWLHHLDIVTSFFNEDIELSLPDTIVAEIGGDLLYLLKGHQKVFRQYS